MSHNYTLVTIKTLFGQASHCAYPNCREPLIFEDRGQSTVVAQIAHIRSETPGGPRHDPGYPADVLDAPENLLLLCGKHHPPVDRHESTYGTAELLEWKERQAAQAAGGIPISDSQARSFMRITPEERETLVRVARAIRRLELSTDGLYERLGPVFEQWEAERLRQEATVLVVDEKGNRLRVELPEVDNQRWRAQVAATFQEGIGDLRESRNLVHEDLAVLAMISDASVRDAVERLGADVDEFVRSVTPDKAVAKQYPALDIVALDAARMRDRLHSVWALANGGWS